MVLNIWNFSFYAGTTDPLPLVALNPVLLSYVCRWQCWYHCKQNSAMLRCRSNVSMLLNADSGNVNSFPSCGL